MRIHPPNPRMAAIAAAVARQAYPLMPERDAHDVANNLVMALDGARAMGERVDAVAVFTAHIGRMVKNFGTHPSEQFRFHCSDVVMAGALMGQEYMRQVRLEMAAERGAA